MRLECSWKEVDSTLVSALTRLQWQRMSEFESKSRVDGRECGEAVAEVIGTGLSAGGAAAEEARVIVCSSVDNWAAMKVSEAESVTYQSDRCIALTTTETASMVGRRPARQEATTSKEAAPDILVMWRPHTRATLSRLKVTLRGDSQLTQLIEPCY